MIYLLYGPNAHARQNAYTELYEGIIKRNPDIDVRTFDSEDAETTRLLYEYIAGSSLFSKGRRIAILSETEKLYTDELFKKALMSASGDESIIVISLEKWGSRKMPKDIAKTLKDIPHTNKFFEKYSPEEQKHIIEKCIKKNACDIDAWAIRDLVAICENDIVSIENEIEKLSFLNKKITREVLQEVYGRKSDPFFFHTKYLTSKTPCAERLFHWECIYDSHVDLFMVFHYLAKATQDKKEIAMLAQGDCAIKSGRMDIEQVLLLYSLL